MYFNNLYSIKEIIVTNDIDISLYFSDILAALALPN